jgi:hypothetical protein
MPVTFLSFQFFFFFSLFSLLCRELLAKHSTDFIDITTNINQLQHRKIKSQTSAQKIKQNVFVSCSQGEGKNIFISKNGYKA